ncbi:MAG: hypothetical protein PHI88_00275 [Candidatus Pacebacteria bacterium]|jgi:hypothetical protein|nr:hypothetical protein [Candidatus Paceibacterota bacterium]
MEGPFSNLDQPPNGQENNEKNLEDQLKKTSEVLEKAEQPMINRKRMNIIGEQIRKLGFSDQKQKEMMPVLIKNEEIIKMCDEILELESKTTPQVNAETDLTTKEEIEIKEGQLRSKIEEGSFDAEEEKAA